MHEVASGEHDDIGEAAEQPAGSLRRPHRCGGSDRGGALYRHFPSKEALLDAMAEKLLEGVGAPVPPGPWDEQLRIIGHRFRAALLAHRDGARVVAGTYVAAPNTRAVGTAVISVLCGAGIPVERAGWIAFAGQVLHPRPHDRRAGSAAARQARRRLAGA